MYINYKEEKPEVTIQRIRDELFKMGLFITEKIWTHPYTNVYSCMIEVYGTDISSFGKGISSEYCLASAYGELIEELNTGIIFSSLFLSLDAQRAYGFWLDPLECYQHISLPESFKNSYPFQGNLSAYEYYENLYGNKKDAGVTLPFTDIFTGELHYLPYGIVSMMNGSNGICAGNTQEEALVHGLSEILERYAIKQFYTKKLFAPVIPTNALKQNFKFVYNMIEEIEKNGEYRVIVKDCTINQTIPVMGIILFNLKERTYAVNFGADPDLSIALHRCLTEVFQGDITKKMNPLNMDSTDEIDYNEYNKFIKSGNGKWPVSFMVAAGESEPKVEHFHSIQEKYIRLSEIFKDCGAQSIYVRDCGYVAMKSYEIVIPGFSEAFLLPEYFTTIHKNKNELKYLQNILSLEQEDIVAFVKALEIHLDYRFHGMRNFVQDYLRIQFDSEYWDNMTLECLLFILHIKLGDYKRAGIWIERYKKILMEQGGFDSTDFINEDCFLDYFHLEEDETISPNQYSCILLLYYEPERVENVIKTIHNPDILLGQAVPLICHDCEQCTFTNCNYKAIENVYLTVKKWKSLIHREEFHESALTL